jgi:hypothetical protein
MRVGIAATVKAEAPYLVEWIAFHRTVGIERFFVADNGGDDGTSELLKQLDAAGYIRRFDFTGQAAPQLTSYNIIVPLMNDVVDLVAIVDVDDLFNQWRKVGSISRFPVISKIRRLRQSPSTGLAMAHRTMFAMTMDWCLSVLRCVPNKRSL